MPILTTCFLSINPEVEKLKYVIEYNHSDFENDFDFFDIKSSYFICRNDVKSKHDILKEYVKSFYNNKTLENTISSGVLENSLNLIDLLSPLQIEELEFNNFSITPYGTVVFDWEKDRDNVFSLELGSKSIGYFIEVNGRDEKQIDSISLNDSKSELFKDLSSFLKK
jgi:hypothetical protein